MRILLVEDHPALRDMVREYLVQEGFTLDSVARADEALSALRTTSYDAVILDLGLPDQNGMAILDRLRAGSLKSVPVLVLTARDALDDRVRGLNAGADDYLVKPFNLVELQARLRAVLRRPGMRDRTSYGCGALRFDTISRTAEVGDVALNLTRREAAVLEELIRVAGQVVVKDVLEDRLYGFDEPVTSNALEVAVSRVRRKIQEAGSGVRIESKRGIGYRLVAGAEE